MNMVKPVRKLFILLALVFIMPAFFACNDDEEPEPEPTITYFEWYASGEDVAPLFRAFPMNYDSIYIRFRSNVPNIYAPDVVRWRVYIEKYKDGTPIIVTGSDQPTWGAEMERDDSLHDGIISFQTTNAVENGTPRTITGIFREFPSGNRMMLEYVYSHWAISPPSPFGGFGSTAEGAYGNNNIHVFTRIGNDNGEEEDE